MNILLVGSGGREHALAWKIAQSQRCEKLYCAPGNAGIAKTAECLDIAAEDVDALVQFAKNNAIDLVVVGPEAPLVLGLTDRLRSENIAVFGPSKAAATLEGSKGFMKDICAKYNIPTASYQRFKDIEAATKYINSQASDRLVVKADGLAAGKGVIICENKDEAIAAAAEMLSGESFGKAGAEIVVEQFLDGEELSYFALSDGKTMLPLASAQDHKRAFEGDKGPNTGGMGAYSPAGNMNSALEEKILHRIIRPTIDAMAKEGCAFTGVLFAGLMVVKDEPYLIEYNVRFGDPECQAIMMRLQADLVEILNGAATGSLDDVRGKVSWSADPTMCVVMATEGYPGSYPKNTVIKGLDAIQESDDLVVFHAGTAKSEAGEIVNVGGRVLGVTAQGSTLAQAREKAYATVDKIDWPDGFCRPDIGWRALEKDEAA